MSLVMESSDDASIKFYGGNLDAMLYKPADTTDIRQKFCILVGAAGTGKSYAIATKLFFLCIKYPGVKCLMARKSLPALRRSMVETFQEVLKDNGYSDRVRILGETRPTAFIFPESSQTWDGITYSGISKIELSQIDMKGKALGSQYDIIVFSQPDTDGLTYEEFTQLSTRARLSNMPYRQILADPNPALENHWLIKNAITEDNPDGHWRLFTSVHEDNPKLFNHEANEWTDKGIEHIEGLKMLPPHLRTSQLEGKWYSLEGMIFAEVWDESKHVFRLEDTRARELGLSTIKDGEFVNNIPKDWHHYLSIDWGYDPDPYCAVLIAKHPRQDLYIVHKHIYITKTDIFDVCEMTRDMIKGYNIKAVIADRAIAETKIMESYLDTDIIGASKGPGSVESGINLMLSELKTDKWLFLDKYQSLQHEPDPELVRKQRPIGYDEIAQLKRDEKNGLLAKHQPDHFTDALRYFQRWLIEGSQEKKYKFDWSI